MENYEQFPDTIQTTTAKNGEKDIKIDWKREIQPPFINLIDEKLGKRCNQHKNRNECYINQNGNKYRMQHLRCTKDF